MLRWANKPHPLAAIFFDESWWLEQHWKRVTKDTFLPSYIEIGPFVYGKKIFKVFYIDTYIGKISPAMFWRIQTAWTILVEDHQKNISAKLYGNRSSVLGQDDFYIFLYIGKISPAHWRPCFLTNPNGSNNLGRGSLKKHFYKIIWKSVQWFLTRRYRYIGKISPTPWQPCFLTNPNGLKNLGRGSPKEHFCKIILKWVQWFRARRFLKFSI